MLYAAVFYLMVLILFTLNPFLKLCVTPFDIQSIIKSYRAKKKPVDLNLQAFLLLIFSLDYSIVQVFGPSNKASKFGAPLASICFSTCALTPCSYKPLSSW